MEKLLAIPALHTLYVQYWLASADSFYLRNVTYSGNEARGWKNENGVRPVVSLKPTVKTTGTDIIGAWDIEIAE